MENVAGPTRNRDEFLSVIDTRRISKLERPSSRSQRPMQQHFLDLQSEVNSGKINQRVTYLSQLSLRLKVTVRSVQMDSYIDTNTPAD